VNRTSVNRRGLEDNRERAMRMRGCDKSFVLLSLNRGQPTPFGFGRICGASLSALDNQRCRDSTKALMPFHMI
jgi:hypothetical protein